MMHRSFDSPVGRSMRSGRSAARDPALPGTIRHAAGAVIAAGLLVAGGQGSAGHSVGHFPSYYPDEIRIETVDPAAAAKGLSDETLHAYIGAAPAFPGPIPEHVKPVRSLGSFLVLSFNPRSARAASPEARCKAAREILAAIGGEKTAGFVFHPYPVTPYHSDYLHHVDRVETAAAVGNASAPVAALKIDAKGPLAEIIAKKWRGKAETTDAILEEVPAARLLAGSGVQFDGWSGLPWAKEGWFQAYQMLAPALDAGARQAADEIRGQLLRGETIGLTERVNLERRLVAALTGGCGRVVVGYAPREEYIDDRYPAGIENVAFDSLSGLNSPLFLRTVKLKEYPWNGKLRLGVHERATAAWNPVAGFTDATGRLIWSAVGDPAMIAFPFNASWMPNRVQAAVEKLEGQSGGIRVPADALHPQPGTGTLKRVDARTVSSAKVTYDVLTSPFEDGSKMTAADAIYPFVFAYRWGSKREGAADAAFEPGLAASVSAIQERFVGFKVVRVERTKHTIAEDMEIIQMVPVVEIYLRNVPRDESEVSALVPPWSTVPWHLLALMEEAVIRGYAAFSQEESARRKVPWLDLVRDDTLKKKLLELTVQFERESYRPEPLKDFVTAEEARERWQMLRAFAETHGHFLVANGPYRLKQWSPNSVTLDAVREMTYPLGFGTYDRFVNPPMAVIDTVTQDADKITVGAKAEMLQKMGRVYKLTSEPLLRTTMRGTFGLLVVSRYLLIGPDGTVLDVDKMQWRDDGRFAIDLPQHLPPGEYKVVLTVFLDGNSMLPSAKILRFRPGGRASPG